MMTLLEAADNPTTVPVRSHQLGDLADALVRGRRRRPRIVIDLLVEVTDVFAEPRRFGLFDEHLCVEGIVLIFSSLLFLLSLAELLRLDLRGLQAAKGLYRDNIGLNLPDGILGEKPAVPHRPVRLRVRHNLLRAQA